MRIRCLLLSSCCVGGMLLGSVVGAKEPSATAIEARRAQELQRARAWQLIHERAAREQRERRGRIEARRRAGISLQRPVMNDPWDLPVATLTKIGDETRRSGSGRVR